MTDVLDPPKLKVVGTRPIRPDGVDKVTGRAQYGADLLNLGSEEYEAGEGGGDLRDLSLNVMARGKALYEGHAVAAVAATSALIAEQALELIDIRYEVLPHVIDVEAAM